MDPSHDLLITTIAVDSKFNGIFDKSWTNTSKHPFISLNGDLPKTPLKPTQKETDSLSMTLFHEQLHNLGIRHTESIEFPYTCEICCIKKDEGVKTANACKVCAGAYSGPTDKNYITDFIKWSKGTYNGDMAISAVMRFQKEFPKDRFGLFAYADAATDIFSPVGGEMGKILKEKFTNLTPDEEALLKSSGKFANVENVKSSSRYSKIVAESLVTLLYENNPKKVLDLLESNKSDLKEMLKIEASAKDSDKIIYGDIKSKLSTVFLDIKMNGYPQNNSPENKKAIKLMTELGL